MRSAGNAADKEMIEAQSSQKIGGGADDGGVARVGHDWVHGRGFYFVKSALAA